jgi:hypothetical protein
LYVARERFAKCFLLDRHSHDEARQDHWEGKRGGVAFEPQGETEKENEKPRVEGMADAAIEAGVD